MKKFWALFTVLAFGTLSFAHANGTVGCNPKKVVHQKSHHPVKKEPCAPPCLLEASCFQSGFYAGLQGGYSLLNGKYKNEFFNGAGTSILHKTLHDSGIVGEALVGGRIVWENNIITGLEVSGLVDSNRLTHNFLHTFDDPLDRSIFNSQFRRQYAVIPAFVLGYQFCQRWHAFLKFGASISKFKLKEKNENDALTFVTSKHKTTFMPSIGLEYALNCLVSFQGTFSYERYSKIRKTFPQVLGSEPVLSSAFYTTKLKNPSYYTLKFGVLVKI